MPLKFLARTVFAQGKARVRRPVLEKFCGNAHYSSAGVPGAKTHLHFRGSYCSGRMKCAFCDCMPPEGCPRGGSGTKNKNSFAPPCPGREKPHPYYYRRLMPEPPTPKAMRRLKHTMRGSIPACAVVPDTAGIAEVVDERETAGGAGEGTDSGRYQTSLALGLALGKPPRTQILLWNVTTPIPHRGLNPACSVSSVQLLLSADDQTALEKKLFSHSISVCFSGENSGSLPPPTTQSLSLKTVTGIYSIGLNGALSFTKVQFLPSEEDHTWLVPQLSWLGTTAKMKMRLSNTAPLK